MDYLLIIVVDARLNKELIVIHEYSRTNSGVKKSLGAI